LVKRIPKRIEKGKKKGGAQTEKGDCLRTMGVKNATTKRQWGLGREKHYFMGSN